MIELRTGFTTGLCAAAAAKAAAILLFSSDSVDSVTVAARTGAAATFDVLDVRRAGAAVSCAVRKFAGDDPDVTDGMKIVAALSRTDKAGIEVDGGEGVGRVTKPGLKVPVGKAAINPAPMEMITAAVEEIVRRYDGEGGVKVVISIPGGEEIAKKTMNSRLGILGGLSILGTTGIVEPMSESAVIETIKADIDVQLASGNMKLLVMPGNYGLEFAKTILGLPVEDAVKCANYIGETLDHAYKSKAAEVTLIGHAGKLIKLAGGIMNTHSRMADCRMEIFAAHSAMAGAGAETIRRIMSCVTVEAAMEETDRLGISEQVWESIGSKIGFHLRERTRGGLAVEYVVFTQEHGVLTQGRT